MLQAQMALFCRQSMADMLASLQSQAYAFPLGKKTFLDPNTDYYQRIPPALRHDMQGIQRMLSGAGINELPFVNINIRQVGVVCTSGILHHKAFCPRSKWPHVPGHELYDCAA